HRVLERDDDRLRAGAQLLATAVRPNAGGRWRKLQRAGHLFDDQRHVPAREAGQADVRDRHWHRGWQRDGAAGGRMADHMADRYRPADLPPDWHSETVADDLRHRRTSRRVLGLAAAGDRSRTTPA